MIKNEILDKLSNMQSVVWVGQTPPFYCDCIDVKSSSNFRVSSKLHGSFKCLWLYEELLSNFKSWKFYLDECVRLIDADGHLVIRTQENDYINIIKLRK